MSEENTLQNPQPSQNSADGAQAVDATAQAQASGTTAGAPVADAQATQPSPHGDMPAGSRCPFPHEFFANLRKAGKTKVSRRSILGTLGIGGAAVAGAAVGGVGVYAWDEHTMGHSAPSEMKEPFYGEHQSGIVTDTQLQIMVASFDLLTKKREKVIELLKAWSKVAAALCEGRSALLPQVDDPAIFHNYASTTAKGSDEDSLEAWKIAPARMTITFGFTPTFFEKDGVDRFGIKKHKPEALVDLPFFPGEQLVPAHSNGDLIVQVCADDPQVVFHAVRSIARVAPDMAVLRWTQVGFSPSNTGGTPRNLMGFKDGTVNSNAYPPKNLDDTVWVTSEGPDWLKGGSYGVYRRIRMSLEHWDRLYHGDQEKVFGRTKVTGVPLGGTEEFQTIDFNKKDAAGDFYIPINAHIRLSSPEENDGAVILRRSFSYNNGTTQFTERWPPWRQGLEYDAGLVFLAFQKDPRKAFIPINTKLALSDALNQFITHNASAIFVVPPGMKDENDWIGRTLFES